MMSAKKRASVVAGFVTCWVVAQAAPGAAQPASPGAGRSLQLIALQDAAIEADPRLRELQLLTAQSELRVTSIERLRLPSVTLAGQAQAQSSVATAPFNLPDGLPAFSPPKATYDASFRVDQRIVDPARPAQLAVERAELAENQARVRATLYALRQEVNDAFFAAASLQQRADALAASIGVLDSQFGEITARVQEGTALAADAAVVEATLLERRQDLEELQANRRVALARLAKLTGQAVSESDVLVLPELAAAVAAERRAPNPAPARPEYVAFARTRDRLARQGDAAMAQERPAVVAFGRVGYGRPGLNFIGGEFQAYGLAAVQVQWKAWNWGSAGREREALAIQRQIVDAEQAAFTKSLGLAVENDLATIDRLQSVLAIDDRIVSLRAEVDRVTRVRLTQGVVTASESLARNTELLQARYSRAGHQVELAQASARFLTTLGIEVR